MTSAPRILYVITDSGTGGTEKIVGELIKKINRQKFNLVGVVVLKNKREMALQWEKSGVLVYEVGMKRIPGPGAIARFRALLKKIQPDIVHAFLFHAVQMSRLTKKTGLTFKLISSPRVNYRFAGALPMLIDGVLKTGHEFVQAESSATAGFLTDKLGYTPEKVRTIFNGVQVDRALGSGQRAALREKWGIAADEILIGAAGRLHDQKGFDVLLAALRQLQNKGLKFKAVIAGEGPRRSELEAQAAQVPVQFLGRQGVMEPFYAALDIFVLSSRYEGMPNALLEAMAMGVPSVATSVDGVLDIGRDGQNIILVKPNDAGALAEALGRMLSDAALRSTLGKAGETSVAKFSNDAMIQEFEALYKEVLQP